MSITPEERERRRETLGGSDIAAILGCSYPWRTAADVQMEKLYPSVDIKPKGHTKLGNIRERSLVQYAEEERGLSPVIYSPEPVFHDLLPFHANLDGLVPGQATIEAKFVGRPDEWGTPGTAEVPDAVIVQVTWGMYIAGIDVSIVPAELVKGWHRDADIWDVPLDERLGEELFRRGEEWWLRHVVECQPVEPTPPTLGTLQRIVRVPAKTVVVDMGSLARLREKTEARLAAEKAEKEEKARVLAQLGDAEAGTDEDGRLVVTYYEYDRKGYTVAPSKHRKIQMVKGEGE